MKSFKKIKLIWQKSKGTFLQTRFLFLVPFCLWSSVWSSGPGLWCSITSEHQQISQRNPKNWQRNRKKIDRDNKKIQRAIQKNIKYVQKIHRESISGMASVGSRLARQTPKQVNWWRFSPLSGKQHIDTPAIFIKMIFTHRYSFFNLPTDILF